MSQYMYKRGELVFCLIAEHARPALIMTSPTSWDDIVEIYCLGEKGNLQIRCSSVKFHFARCMPNGRIKWN